MSTILNVKEREDLKHSTTSKIRHSGSFPAVIYGKDKPNKNIEVNEIEFTKVMKEAGRNGIIQLQASGGLKEEVMLQDLQTDPLKGEVVHADFYIVDMKSEVDVEVNVHFTGEAKGVQDGGILQQPLHQVAVRSLPGNIPEAIEVDISNLNIGDSIQIKDLKDGRNYEITNDEETVIASILPPIAEEELDSGEVQDGDEEQKAEEADQGKEENTEPEDK